MGQKSSAATKICCGICRINSSLKTASCGSTISTAPRLLPSATSASRPFARSSQIRSIGSGDRAHRAHGAVLTVCLLCCVVVRMLNGGSVVCRMTVSQSW